MIRKECLSTPVFLRPPSPWASLPCSRFHPLVASRIAGSAGCSVRRPRQSHRRERRLRRARPGRQYGPGSAGLAFPARPASPTEGMDGQRDGCVRRTFGALAGYGVRIPRPSPGVRAPLGTPTVGRVLRSPRSDARGGICNLGAPRPAVNRMCSHAAIAVPAGRRAAVAAPYGMCGEITYSYRQLQTPVGLRRLRKRSFGHGSRAPGP